MAVPPEESSQANLSFPAIAVGMQIHLLVLNCAPQPFPQDVVLAARPSCPADLDLLYLQFRHEIARGESATLIGVEDLWLAITCPRHLQSIEAELCVKAVRELPAEHVSGEQNHDCHQVVKSLLQRDVGDVGGPDLFNSRDQPEVQQTRKSLRRVSWNRGAWLLLDRP
jgi:hypothetical protein